MKGQLLSKALKQSKRFVTEEKPKVTEICGISVRRDNPKTGIFMVKSMNDKKRLLSRLGTQILNGNKHARTIAEQINTYGIIIREF
jgi:hypothetical protein